jgi:hypothetical protein
MIGGCAFSCRYSSPLAAPTAILTRCIQSSTGPGWAPFTPFLPAEQPILALNDHKTEREEKILKNLLDVFQSVKTCLQHANQTLSLLPCVTYTRCLKNLLSVMGDVMGFSNQPQKTYDLCIGPCEDILLCP